MNKRMNKRVNKLAVVVLIQLMFNVLFLEVVVLKLFDVHWFVLFLITMPFYILVTVASDVVKKEDVE